MGIKTGIEWTDATWNPLRGCSRVSEGCRHCYAETMAARFSAPGQAYHRTIVNGRWSGEILLVPERLDEPARWRKPRRVFVNSMSDLWHENVSDATVSLIIAAMAGAPAHRFQILTKRPERMRAYFERNLVDGEIACPWPTLASPGGRIVAWPMPNVWLGVSVENQAAADDRIVTLMRTPAAVRFLSCEPLLGPIDLHSSVIRNDLVESMVGGRLLGSIDWVIAGGESGPGARPMHPAWPRSLRDQCVAAGVPFFFKQWGEWSPIARPGIDEALVAVTPSGEVIGRHRWTDGVPDGAAVVYAQGKDCTGRELDGHVWNDFPAVEQGVAS